MYSRLKRRLSLLLSKDNKRTISGAKITMLRTLHPHGMFQDLGISISHRITVRCADCRTPYRYEDICFLSLQGNNVELNCTNCCHTKVHSEFTTDLAALLSLLTYDHSLECGQLTDCNCLWLRV